MLKEKRLMGYDKLSEGAYNDLLDVAKEQHWGVKFIPAQGYYFSKEKGKFEKKLTYNLEGAVGSILIGFTILFLLIRVPITGFVTQAIPETYSTGSKVGLFVLIGLLSSLIVYFILRKFSKKSLE